MTYSVVEVFKTLQGEGHHAGRSAVFVRFAGCNLWSGHDEHRGRDSQRNGAHCPLWCDTDFIKRYSSDLYALTLAIEQAGNADLVVFTGGEPLLQLDVHLVQSVNAMGYITCVETNGTVAAKPGVVEEIQHVCVSPKLPSDQLVLPAQVMAISPALRPVTEVKVVFPAYDPLQYTGLKDGFDYAFVSPEAATSSCGVSVVQRDVEKRAAEFCMNHSGWGLSLQMHKHLGLP